MGAINNDLAQRINEISSRIEYSAKKSGRESKDIKLIGVTKNVDIEVIKKAFELGLKDFGENKVQELLTKYEYLPEANWHFIGRLQTNKVKYLIDKVCLIHSVDSFHLAQEINRQAEKKGLIQDILVQVNITGEETKAGIPPEDCEKLIRQISCLENVRLKGLMTIAPFTNNKEKIRLIFGNLYKLFIDIGLKEIHNINMEYLSAGMTNDFETAIEEGVNIVRIGTGIFGCRF